MKNLRDNPEWVEDCLKYRKEILTGKRAHWCWEWDGLPMDETCEEWPCGCNWRTDMKIEIPEQGTLEIAFEYVHEEVRERVRRFEVGTLHTWQWTLKTNCVINIGEHRVHTWVWDTVEAVDKGKFPGFDYITSRKAALVQALWLFYPSGGTYQQTVKNKERRTLVWKTLLFDKGFKVIGRQ